MSLLKKLADRRAEIHKGHPSSRPLSDDYELVGLSGELALCQFTGLCPDVSERPDGDSGVDGHIHLRYTVDVKTARKPANLIHEAKPDQHWADIYILARFDEETGQSELLGWEWGHVLKQAPIKTMPGHTIANHCISRSKLRSMVELEARKLKIW